MKILITTILLASFAFANYTIKFKGITLGEIENFKSLEHNYLEAKVTNSIARFLLGKDKFVFYNEDFKNKKNDENTKYKKDKYAIIYILKKAMANDVKTEKLEVKKDKFITVSFDENFKFVYDSKGRIKSEGYLEMKDNSLLKLVENINDIEISKIQ
ncbi:hypothetical protein [Arcobacter roscoffensis]|uniref:Uncharacterized protein n=1 Tax=Arcobacter roscoffensis TaxID=2961520 RepID=A0ABY5E8D6_9BACT|nr:hypothetical protein [Arcobacter roscoffensis]UTJ07435.1 hypothetical protein NJU99_04905 [Arcobacter roscoffensis]